MWFDPPEEDSADFADAIHDSAVILGWLAVVGGLALLVAALSGLLPQVPR